MPRIELKKFTCFWSLVFLFSLLFSFALAAPVLLSAAQEPELTLNVPATVIPGGSFIVSGALKAGDTPLVNKPVGMTIKDARGAIFTAAETKTGADGSFAEEFTLPADAPAGAWEIHVAGEGTHNMKNFTVGVPTTGVATASPASLRRGETVTISGVLPQGNVEVGLTIYDPNGRVVFVDQKKAAADGKYQFNYTLPAEAVLGAYRALVAGAGTAGQAIFTVTAPSSPGGGGGVIPSKPEVDKYEPAQNAKDVALDALVRVTFKQEIKTGDLTKVGIKDDKNKEVTGVKATVSGKALVLAHDKFNYETKYIVTIPKRTVKRTDSNTENDALSWSFTTLKKEVPPVLKCEFTDVPSTHWAAACIKVLCEKGIIAGYPDGTYKPSSNITRAEFAKIVAGAVGLVEVKPVTPAFADVPSAHWSYGYVEATARAGLVKGSGGKFRPNDFISRQEIAVILVRAMGKESEAQARAGETTGFKDDVKIAAWARGHVIIAVAESLIEGYPDNIFGPAKNATRAESAKMVNLFREKK